MRVPELDCPADLFVERCRDRKIRNVILVVKKCHEHGNLDRLGPTTQHVECSGRPCQWAFKSVR